LVSTVCPVNKMSGETAGTELELVTHIHDVSGRLGQIKFAYFRGDDRISSVALNPGPQGTGYRARARAYMTMHGLAFIFLCKLLVIIPECLSYT
jgi:hypothetical protein